MMVKTLVDQVKSEIGGETDCYSYQMFLKMDIEKLNIRRLFN